MRELIVKNEQYKQRAELQETQMKVKIEHRQKLVDEISRLEESSTHMQNETDKIKRNLENN